MNILLINHYAGAPSLGMAYRPYYLAREWVRLGHTVSIAAASFSHLRSRPPETKGSFSTETIDGISYVWLKTPRYRGNGVRRALNIFAFAGRLLLHRKRIAAGTRIDVVICSSTHPLDIIPGAKIASTHRAKLVFEVHDLWPLSLVELGGMSWNHPFIRLLSRAEGYACRRADVVASILPLASPHMESRGMSPGKFACLPNGIDSAEWLGPRKRLPPGHRRQVDALRAKGHFLVCYAGAHGIANDLGVLLDAAARLRNHPVTVVLVGQGPEKAGLQVRADRRGLRNVVFLPPVARDSVPALLESMDALYIGLQDQPLFRFGVCPNKLLDYMMAAKPVICAIRAGNDIVAENGCGLTVAPGDPQASADAVLKFLSLGRAEREEMGQRGRRYVQEHHDYRVIARRFLDLLQS